MPPVGAVPRGWPRGRSSARRTRAAPRARGRRVDSARACSAPLDTGKKRTATIVAPDRVHVSLLDSQVGARIANALGIMRACLETAKLERIETRLGELERTTATLADRSV